MSQLLQSLQTIEGEIWTCNWQELYVVQLQTHKKEQGELGWICRSPFTIVDREYPNLQEEVHKHFSLDHYLVHFSNPQVAFGDKQSCPRDLNAAELWVLY